MLLVKCWVKKLKGNQIGPMLANRLDQRNQPLVGQRWQTMLAQCIFAHRSILALRWPSI